MLALFVQGVSVQRVYVRGVYVLRDICPRKYIYPGGKCPWGYVFGGGGLSPRTVSNAPSNNVTRMSSLGVVETYLYENVVETLCLGVVASSTDRYFMLQ